MIKVCKHFPMQL